MPSASAAPRPSRHSPVESPIRFVSHGDNRISRQDEDLSSRREKKVLVLYVGGTIGMLRGKDGELKPSKGYLTRVIHEMKELRERPEIAPFHIIEYEELLDSSDMYKEDYVRISQDVASNYDKYDGFLILHGTDTMHYTASALSFQLVNLDKPIILTGSMIPLVESYNDARRNFVIALMVASCSAIHEVCVFFNDCLLRGNRCCKLHHTFGAFASPKFPPLGVVKPHGFLLHEDLLLPPSLDALTLQSDMSGRVMVFLVHSEWDSKTVLRLLAQDAEDEGEKGRERGGKAKNEKRKPKPLVDGIVLEICGVGSLEGVFSQTMREIARVGKERGVVVCVVLRDPFGTLSTQERFELKKISPDLIYLFDMLSCVAEIKLMYLFGKGLSYEKVAQMMPLNLRGEVTPITDAKL